MSTITEDAILQKTRELCQAIVDQPEFQSLRRHVDTFLANEESKNQYQLVVEKGEALQQKQQMGWESRGPDFLAGARKVGGGNESVMASTDDDGVEFRTHTSFAQTRLA